MRPTAIHCEAAGRAHIGDDRSHKDFEAIGQQRFIDSLLKAAVILETPFGCMIFSVLSVFNYKINEINVPKLRARDKPQ